MVSKNILGRLEQYFTSKNDNNSRFGVTTMVNDRHYVWRYDVNRPRIYIVEEFKSESEILNYLRNVGDNINSLDNKTLA